MTLVRRFPPEGAVQVLEDLGLIHETLSVEQKVDRLLGNLDSFVARVLRPA